MARARWQTEIPEGEEPPRESRAERRRRGEESGALARRLLALAEADLPLAEFPAAVLDELEEARRITSAAARRRHERRLAQVLRDVDVEEVTAALSRLDEARAYEARHFQRVEQWRARLLERDEALEELWEVLSSASPTARGGISALVNEARRERATGKPRGAGRNLFRALRDIFEAEPQ
ncbi:MAG: ribosome biogenesis factor YjgA [Myxococcota bacterium]